MPWIIRVLILLSIGLVIFYGFVLRRLAWALSQHTGRPMHTWRWRLGIAAGIANLYPIILVGSYALGSSLWRTALRGSHPLVDVALVYPFWIGLIVTLQLFVFFVLLDALRLLVRRWRELPEVWVARLMLGLAALVLIYTPLRAYTDTRTIRVREHVIASEKLPPDMSELRIVHISDLQMDARTDPPLIKQVVEKATALRPDLIVFTGDLVTSGTEYIEPAATWLGTLTAQYGIYACLGDHDYWADPRQISSALNRRGIVVLQDESREISVGSLRLRLTGVTNIYRRRPTPETLARLGAEKPNRHMALLIAHQPSPALVRWAKDHQYDLFLAGHTHGGQIALSLPGVRLALARLETPYVSGAYDVGTLWVNVTNGIGLTGAPLRFHAPAEITLLRLIPAPS